MVFLKDNSPDTIRGTINRHKVTHIFAPPVLFHKLHKAILSGVANESERRRRRFAKGLKLAYALQNIFPSLGVRVSKRLFREAIAASFGRSPAFMISGGAPIEKEALKTINCIGYPLFNGYGTTETSITGAALSKRIKARTDGSVGEPFDSVQYSLGEDGSLTVSGKSICKRILLLEGEQSGFSAVKTNDLVKSAGGRYFIEGRKSDLFIGDNGENISPDTIQNELKVKSANRLCVLELNGVLSVVLEYGQNMPNAIIANEAERIKRDLAAIPGGRYIGNIFAVRQPISSANAIKISRALLRKKIDENEVVPEDCKALQRGGGGQGDSPDDDTMSLIKRAFAAAADTDAEVLPASNFFFDLGGTSLDYMMLIGEMKSIFNIEIDLEKSRNLHTPASFYAYVTELL
jgi:acyl-CoA synthetase (AMP-forming)/AMP-acid ligase II/acyl carrier protein